MIAPEQDWERLACLLPHFIPSEHVCGKGRNWMFLNDDLDIVSLMSPKKFMTLKPLNCEYSVHTSKPCSCKHNVCMHLSYALYKSSKLAHKDYFEINLNVRNNLFFTT